MAHHLSILSGVRTKRADMMVTENDRDSRKVLSIEPWPERGIDNYRLIENGRWGWLTIFEDLEAEFTLDNPPSREEILQRWGPYLAE